MSQHSALIVVPACNEEATIGPCIRSIRKAMEAAVSHTSALVVVVCDSCTDGTYAIAGEAFEGLPFVLLRVNFRSVGRTRDWGARIGLRVQPETDWIAFTDADSCVKPNWLKLQIAASDVGFDAFFGRVDFADDSDMLRAFKERYETQAHRYIHGANMGLSKAAYDSVGGIPLLKAHEDRILVERLEALDLNVLWDERAAVHTSARMIGRAPEGFAATLGAFAGYFEPCAES